MVGTTGTMSRPVRQHCCSKLHLKSAIRVPVYFRQATSHKRSCIHPSTSTCGESDCDAQTAGCYCTTLALDNGDEASSCVMIRVQMLSSTMDGRLPNRNSTLDNHDQTQRACNAAGIGPYVHSCHDVSFIWLVHVNCVAHLRHP